MFRHKNSITAFGFTLIELIVVIAIIGILTSIVLANLTSARAGARDDIRKTDIKNLQVAVELYKAQNGSYPLSCRGSNIWGGTIAGPSLVCPPGTDYIVGLVPDYIAALPVDSRYPTQNQGYIYRSTGVDYKILAYESVESKTIATTNDEFARCPRLGFGGCLDLAAIDATYGVYSGNTLSVLDW